MTATIDMSDRPSAIEHPYRAFVTFDAAREALDRVREQLSVWLDQKHWDAGFISPHLTTKQTNQAAGDHA